MQSKVLVRGAVAGMIGGAVMAMWSMIVLYASGVGFVTPLNLIAHLVLRSAPLGATFDGAAFVVGMVIHMMVSMMLGIALAVLLGALGARWAESPVRAASVGVVFGLLMWVVMALLVWRAADSAAAHLFTPWVFAVGHAMFGAAAGVVFAAGRQPSSSTAALNAA